MDLGGVYYIINFLKLWQNIIFAIVTNLTILLSDINYIHNVVQPSPLSISIIFPLHYLQCFH